MAKRNVNGEMSERLQSNRWYPLRLGSSLVDRSPSKKFCTLRYEFKPTSIDNTWQGRLCRDKENRDLIEFYNNHAGNPKVSFEGSSEDYKDTHAVLFLDGNTFRLEKLHRAYKSLKHKRILGQSKSNGDNEGTSSAEADSPLRKVARTQAVNRPSIHALPIEVEKINIARPEKYVAPKHANNKTNAAHQSSSSYFFCPPYPENKPYDDYDRDQDLNMPLDILGDYEYGTPNCLHSSHHTSTIDAGFPNHHPESDDNIDIDLLDDTEPENEGLSAAEILRAQMTICGTGDAQGKQGGRGQETSSSGGESSSSGSSSGSTGSWSGSSNSDGSDADSDCDGTSSSGSEESDTGDDGADSPSYQKQSLLRCH